MKAANAFGKALERLLFKWMWHKHVGHFNSNVSNVGTGMCVSMQLKFPTVVIKQVSGTHFER